MYIYKTSRKQIKILSSYIDKTVAVAGREYEVVGRDP